MGKTYAPLRKGRHHRKYAYQNILDLLKVVIFSTVFQLAKELFHIYFRKSQKPGRH